MFDVLLIVLLLSVCAAAGALLVLAHHRRGGDTPVVRPAVAIGTVRSVDAAITVEVERVTGETFTGRLRGRSGELHPGQVLLVAFDPAAREDLSLPDDMVAVRAAFDRMMLSKGLITDTQLELIRRGTKSHGVVTASRATGSSREDYREVIIDLMVRKPEGGQFPAHETTLIPATSLDRVCPGSIVDTYYVDESAVAVCVPPA